MERRRGVAVVDMTEQKRAEEAREEHLWFLACMDRINRAMQRTNEVEGITRGLVEEALAIIAMGPGWYIPVIPMRRRVAR